MIGEGHGGHAQFSRPFDEVADAAGTVEQGEVGVDVEVDEGVGHRPGHS